MNESEISVTESKKEGPFKTRLQVAPLNATRLGAAFGLTGVVFYVGCILTMSTVPREKAVMFFNSLLHGLDVDPILRTDVSTFEMVLGVISTFVLGWFAGALVAGFYNWGTKFRRREP